MGDAADDAERRAETEQETDAIADDEYESSQALVIREERENTPAPASVLPSSKEWEATMAVAREIAGTQFVPESYRGKPDAVVAAILTGREMGIGPMQALRQIHMIDGRPAFSADLMMAKMRAGGITIIESSVADGVAYIKAKRRDTGEEAEVDWTMADAEKAGLLGKKNWKTYPDDMLWARVVGRLARRLGSDLLGGLVYAKEEMEDWEGGGYGGAYGFEATTARQFDPETDLHPNAISGKDAPKALRAALDQFDPTVDWSQVVADICNAQYGTDTLSELTPEQYQDFWRRLSNSVQWIQERAGSGDMPPVDPEKIISGFAYGFSGASVSITFVSTEELIGEITSETEDEGAPLSKEQAAEVDAALAKDEDVPFGDDKKED